MTEVIYDKTQLLEACEPFEFIDDKGKDETVVDEMKTTIAALKEVLNNTDKIVALSAPQIGIKKRVFCIKFADTIKTFVNPVIKRRSEEKFINQEQFIDGESVVYICRPKEVEVTYFTDEFKVEDNKLLDQAAATFIQQYNLLDGIVPGAVLDTFETVTQDSLPKFVEATYSGSGIVLTKEDSIPDLEEVAEVLAKLSAGANAKLKDLIETDSDEDLKKLAKRFLFEESVILGRTKIVDEEGWEKEKKAKRQVAISKKKIKDAEFKQFAAKACK